MAQGGPLPNPPQAKKERTATSTPTDPKKLTGVRPVKEATMMASPPAQSSPQPTGDPAQQSASPSSYQQTYDQFSQAQSPDPNTFLQLIWPHLTSHQKDLIKALLASPQGQAAMAQSEQGEDQTGAATAGATPPQPSTPA